MCIRGFGGGGDALALWVAANRGAERNGQLLFGSGAGDCGSIILGVGPSTSSGRLASIPRPLAWYGSCCVDTHAPALANKIDMRCCNRCERNDRIKASLRSWSSA